MIRKSISGFHLGLSNIKLNKNTLDDLTISIIDKYLIKPIVLKIREQIYIL